MPRPGRSGQPNARPPRASRRPPGASRRPPCASQRPPRAPRPKRPKNAHFHRSGLHFEHASQKSHVISLGQFLISPTNVAIPTMPIQSLKGLHGNYVRHFWGTIPLTGRGGAMTGGHPEAPQAASTTAKPEPRAPPPSRERYHQFHTPSLERYRQVCPLPHQHRVHPECQTECPPHKHLERGR